MTSIRDGDACKKAADLLRRGLPVGTYIRGVCGLWADGQREDGLDALYRIKGEKRARRPVGTALTSAVFIEKLDPDKISPSVRDLIMDDQELSERLGSMCFIRAPIKGVESESLPDRLVSISEDGTYWIQNWLPEGCSSISYWMETLGKMRVSLPVVTSMNVSGQPEIVSQEKGRQFCAAKGVPMFLGDPENPGRAHGSFPILQVDSEGITLVREGHFAAKTFQSLLSGWDIDLTSYQPAKFPLIDVPDIAGEVIDNPLELRRQLLTILDGSA
jgi:tRNA A37 threonylcarbamoyladenosine synthetase subunit TsaC/SUA5/YrdC